jgi:hypothetical protein
MGSIASAYTILKKPKHTKITIKNVMAKEVRSVA